jgi:hypothetical protein
VARIKAKRAAACRTGNDPRDARLGKHCILATTKWKPLQPIRDPASRLREWIEEARR